MIPEFSEMMRYIFLSLLLIFSTQVISQELHVSLQSGDDNNPGTELRPFKTISKAASVAQAGNMVIVHSGIYREWVDPKNGGTSNENRIVYRAAAGEDVEIKGSEVIRGWKRVKGTVWKMVLPNSFLGDYNPYKDSIYGDWFNDHGRIHHTGEVFLNGKSLFEMETLEKVTNPLPMEGNEDREGSLFTWYCESDHHNTTIWANFQQYNPNKELIEISVRRTCFYPSEPGVNYLTISGFRISQAATQWAAPTAEQIGMIATHWNKGWIIENNIISDSKCSGITLGKERATGHNVWSADRSIDGSIHYIEVTFRTLQNGWNKENIGSHIVRNNVIYNCEQTGICGSMGAAFSVVENNHIYNIWTKRQFSGAEIAGIKFHAAIDTRISRNRIHNVGKGIWLDWMSQGVRVAGNLLYKNDQEDLFVEVNHGPALVDNNVFLSPIAIRNQSEGFAYVHNLIGGIICNYPEPGRFTPYHLPHSTAIAGLSTIYSGDDRYYNNIFLGKGAEIDIRNRTCNYGLVGYNNVPLTIWTKGNVFYNRAMPYKKDSSFTMNKDFVSEPEIFERNGDLYLRLKMDDKVKYAPTVIVNTNLLGQAKIPKARFENPDGSKIEIDQDFMGKKRNKISPTAGPFEDLNELSGELKVWEKMR